MVKGARKAVPKVGFFGMASCKGCYFQLLLLGERLLDVFGNIEVSHFWMLKEVNDDARYDIAFLDGAVANAEGARLVKKVRKMSKYLIAFGTCACLGGIPALRNLGKGHHKTVYGKKLDAMPSASVDPVEKHAKVDYRMYGCPVNENEALAVVRDLLLGKKPREPDHPVCVDCKKAGTACLFKEGVPCLGPVTRGGCGAPCPASRTPCDGCRGPLPDANCASEVELLHEHGITDGKIRQLFGKYTGRENLCGRAKGRCDV